MRRFKTHIGNSTSHMLLITHNVIYIHPHSSAWKRCNTTVILDQHWVKCVFSLTVLIVLAARPINVQAPIWCPRVGTLKLYYSILLKRCAFLRTVGAHHTLGARIKRSSPTYSYPIRMRLTWYGNVRRRAEQEPTQQVFNMTVNRERLRGRSRLRQ